MKLVEILRALETLFGNAENRAIVLVSHEAPISSVEKPFFSTSFLKVANIRENKDTYITHIVLMWSELNHSSRFSGLKRLYRPEVTSSETPQFSGKLAPK